MGYGWVVGVSREGTSHGNGQARPLTDNDLGRTVAPLQGSATTDPVNEDRKIEENHANI